MKLVIAEKPSVGSGLANVLGAKTRKVGKYKNAEGKKQQNEAKCAGAPARVAVKRESAVGIWAISNRNRMK
jgi:hypothetical protein